jgi:hypothetical protein
LAQTIFNVYQHELEQHYVSRNDYTHDIGSTVNDYHYDIDSDIRDIREIHNVAFQRGPKLNKDQ